jgi:hypothetical protein
MERYASKFVLGLKVLVVITFLAAGTAFGQVAIPPDTFSVGFFVSANTPGISDENLFLVNPGTSGGDLCADIYVFDTHGRMQECCGCTVKQNGLQTLSVNTDLTANPLNPVHLTKGVLKIISSLGAPNCNPGSPVPTEEIWAYTKQKPDGTAAGNVAAKWTLPNATLSSSELYKLEQYCLFIQGNGSGHGVCSCGTSN